MVPRTEIVAIDQNDSINGLKKIITKTDKSYSLQILN